MRWNLRAVVVACMMSGCAPTPEDVERARRQGAGAKLLKYLRNGAPDVQLAALEALMSAGTAEQQGAAAAAVFGTVGGDEVVDALLAHCPRNEALLQVAWDAILLASDDQPESLGCLKRASDSVLREFVASRSAELKAAHPSAPEKWTAAASKLVDRELPIQVESLLRRLQVEAEAARIAFAAPDTDIRPLLRTAGEARQALERRGATSTCELGEILAPHAEAAIQAASSSDIHDLLQAVAPSLCGDRRRAVMIAWLKAVEALQVGYEIGRKIEVRPARYCCRYFGSCDPDDRFLSTRAACANSNDPKARWVEIEPAQYAFAEGSGPRDDAKTLKRVATLLAGAGAMIRDRDLLDVSARAQRMADEMEGESLLEKRQRLEREIEQLTSQRSEYLYLRGHIVANHGNNIYEFTTVHAVPSCGSISCSTPPHIRPGQRGLVQTVFTRFTTKGLFSMWVEKKAERDITTVDGFVESWKVYAEVDGDIPRDLVAEITRKTKQLKSLAKDAESYSKRMDSERRKLGEEVARVLARM